MPETIKVWLDDQIGLTGQFLWLRKADGSLLNTEGDALSESPSGSGQFSATLAESRSGLGTLRAVVTGSSDPADALFAGWLAESETLVSEELPTTGALTTDQANQLSGVAAAVSGASKIEATGRVAAGGKVTAYIGDDFRVRSGTALPIPVADPTGAIYTKLTTITATNLRFAVTSPGKSGSQITGTISGITQSGSGASRLCLIAVEITNCGATLPPGDQYFYQIDQIQNTSDDFVEIEGKFLLKQRARAV